MPETIDVTVREFPGHFLLAAIVADPNGREIAPVNPVTVELKVNGVEVPFSATLDDLYGRMRSQIDKEAYRLAADKITAAGLTGIENALRTAEWKIKDALAATSATVLSPEESAVLDAAYATLSDMHNWSLSEEQLQTFQQLIKRLQNPPRATEDYWR